MSYEDPKRLQRLVFFSMLTYIFVFEECKSTLTHKITQLERQPQDDVTIYDEHTFYKYTEFISKNNKHRFKDVHGSSKAVELGPCYARMGKSLFCEDP